MVEREALWKQVISMKYGVEEWEGYTLDGRKGLGVGLWKEIRKEGSLLSNNIVFTLSPLCLLWRFQKRSGWRRFGTPIG